MRTDQLYMQQVYQSVLIEIEALKNSFRHRTILYIIRCACGKVEYPLIHDRSNDNCQKTRSYVFQVFSKKMKFKLIFSISDFAKAMCFQKELSVPETLFYPTEYVWFLSEKCFC